MSENTPSVAEILGFGLDFFRNLPEGVRDLIVADARHLLGAVAAELVKAVVFQVGPYPGVTTTDEARQRAHDLALAHARVAAAVVLTRNAQPVDTDQARGLR